MQDLLSNTQCPVRMFVIFLILISYPFDFFGMVRLHYERPTIRRRKRVWDVITKITSSLDIISLYITMPFILLQLYLHNQTLHASLELCTRLNS
ncbi:hypothetical protein BKA69DRAFT_298085 [Paraphysoderma sedebokerense]|nr:hypothetical protein BKA69DRAFT_298085 [Paraphysoderma sedebokerense]